MAGTPTKRAPRKATTSRAAAARSSAAPVKPRVTLDLDSISKSKVFPDLKLPTAPFTFLLNGHTYELRDPRDSDWKQALELARNPFLLMRTALVGADDPIDEPTEMEMACCRERLGLVSQDVADAAELVADGRISGENVVEDPVPTLIDRLTAADLPAWKLNALFDNWHSYYKIDLGSGKGLLAALLGVEK